jgi:hypothetical protein
MGSTYTSEKHDADGVNIVVIGPRFCAVEVVMSAMSVAKELRGAKAPQGSAPVF